MDIRDIAVFFLGRHMREAVIIAALHFAAAFAALVPFVITGAI